MARGDSGAGICRTVGGDDLRRRYAAVELQAMLPTGGNAQNLQITLGGQLTAKGRDLVYVLGKENFKTDILGG